MGFRQARLKASLSVRQVMKELNVSDAAVYLWETGKTCPRASMLLKLAKLYGVTVDDLLKPDHGKEA